MISVHGYHLRSFMLATLNLIPSVWTYAVFLDKTNLTATFQGCHMQPISIHSNMECYPRAQNGPNALNNMVFRAKRLKKIMSPESLRVRSWALAPKALKI